MDRTCSTNEEKKNVYEILVEQPKKKKAPQGRHGARWVDNIRWILERYYGVEWIGLIWLMIRAGEWCL
jgi:hypothetical protein